MTYLQEQRQTKVRMMMTTAASETPSATPSTEIGETINCVLSILYTFYMQHSNQPNMENSQ